MKTSARSNKSDKVFYAFKQLIYIIHCLVFRTRRVNFFYKKYLLSKAYYFFTRKSLTTDKVDIDIYSQSILITTNK